MRSQKTIYRVLGCLVVTAGLIGSLGARSDNVAASQAAARHPQRSAWVGALDRVLSREGLEGAKVSALVMRHRDGRVLYQRDPDHRRIPASNAKLLTALATLDAFGPTHQFVTEVRSDAPPGPQGEVANLYLRGGGDPAITSEDWWRLAAELRDAGLRSVGGDLVLDDSFLDRVRWHPSVEGISSRAYHAPVGALNANYGSFAVTVRPGAKVGDPVLVTVTPPLPYLRIANEGRTLRAKVRRSLVVDRADGLGFEVVSIHGGVRVGDSPKTYYRSVLHPDLYAGAVLKRQLAAVGVQVAGAVRSAAAPAGAPLLHAFKGRPVAEIVRLFMKFSNNVIAETLVKNLGALASGGPGSWENGVPEMRRRLIAEGVSAEGFSLVDGSGLSYRDRISPRALVMALRVGLRSFRWGPEFVSSLPIAARDGTLEERAESAQDRVRAKTGLLNRVTGLSGYTTMANPCGGFASDRVVFSVLANDYRHGDKAAMNALDRFAALLGEAPSAEQTP